jgi:TetR/AcrR family transcriptional regulator, regulator of mycofactocin system
LSTQQGERRKGRPPVSSQEEIENCAVTLFLDKGFDQTSMDEIAAACGVGRTTLFRYFPSKADILWTGFDRHLLRLADLLTSQPEDLPVLTAVEMAAVQAFEEAADEKELWRRRFEVLEQTPSLHPSVSARWFDWGGIVAQFIAARTARHPEDVVPASIGGAIQGAYLAALRTWRRSGDFGGDVAERMRNAIHPVCETLSPLIDGGRS